MNRETAIKNLGILVREPSIAALQPGPSGNTLERKGSWNHREVTISQNNSEDLEKVQNIIRNTLTCVDQFPDTGACLTDSEVQDLSHTLLQLPTSLRNCASTTQEETERKNLLLTIFQKTARVGLENKKVLAKALEACTGLLYNENRPDIAVQALALAKAGLSAEKVVEDASIRRGSLEILTLLVEKELSYDIALQAAVKGLSDQDATVRCASLRLLVALVKQGLGIQEAHAALLATKNSPFLIHWRRVELFEALFAMNQGFDPLILQALEGLHPFQNRINAYYENQQYEPNWPYCDPSLLLSTYRTLVNKERGYEAAIKLATDVWEKRLTHEPNRKGSSNLQICLAVSSLKLLKALVDKGQAYNEAIKAAVESTRSSEPAEIDAAFYLLKSLLEQGQGIKEASELYQRRAQGESSCPRAWTAEAEAAFNAAFWAAKKQQESSKSAD